MLLTLAPSYGLLVRNDGSREATLAVRKECMKKSSSCSLGQITSSVTCTQCFQYILSDTFLGMVAGEPSLLQDSHELKRKTLNYQPPLL